ncbi:MAG TPA: S4 domain-containing protein YaaA [Massilibacterium sp.]|nr:S4 domain-containing protein YaaA [Massilibacterium sp.]
MKKIKIDTEYITLTQALKLAEVIDTGGMVKWFLTEHKVFVNNELEQRRGKKLYPGDVIKIEGMDEFIIES